MPIGAQGSLYRGARAGPGPGACLPRGGGAYGGHKSLRGGGCPGLGGPQGLWGARSPRAPGRRSARSGVTAGPLRNGPGPGPGGGRRVPGMRLGLRLRPGSVPGRRGAAGGAGYRQGQSPTPRTREYFYYIDHQGQVRGDTGTPPPHLSAGSGRGRGVLGGSGSPPKNNRPGVGSGRGGPVESWGGNPRRSPKRSQVDPGWSPGRDRVDHRQSPGRARTNPKNDPKRTPERSQTEPTRSQDRSQTDPRWIPDRSQTNPKQNPHGAKTDPRQNPRQIPDGSWTDPRQIPDRP